MKVDFDPISQHHDSEADMGLESSHQVLGTWVGEL